MLGRTARSIQIWFQNRRAKLRLITREQLKKPTTPSNETKLLSKISNLKKVSRNFEISKIRIGTWEFLNNDRQSVNVAFDTERSQISWEMMTSTDFRRIEFDYFDVMGLSQSPEESSITFRLLRPPRFSKREDEISMWSNCEDFTPHKEASRFKDHVIYFADAEDVTNLMGTLTSIHPRFTGLLVKNVCKTSGELCFDFVKEIEKLGKTGMLERQEEEEEDNAEANNHEELKIERIV